MHQPLIHLTIGFVIAFWMQAKFVYTIECYSCQYADTDTWQGYSCVSDPDRYRLGPPVVQCPGVAQACYSYVEYYPDRREIKYAYRGCSDQTKVDDCVFVGAELHCTYTCSTGDKCNTDDLIELKPELLAPVVTPNGTNRRRYRTLPFTPTTVATPAHSKEFFLCYSCTYNYNPHGDDSCVTSPNNARQPNTVICLKDGKHACATRRQFAIGDNVIRSFYRGCELRETLKDSCEKDLHFNTCFSYCRGELCNGQPSDVSVDDQRQSKAVGTKNDSATNEVQPTKRNGPANRSDMTSPKRRRPGIGWQRKMANSSAVTRCQYLSVYVLYSLAGFLMIHRNLQ